MATIQEAIKRLIYQFTSTGADKVAADHNKVADANANLAVKSQATEKASLSLDKAFANLERRFDSTIRAQQDYEKVQAKVNAAVAQNPELQERANNVLAKAAEHFDKAKGAGGALNQVLEAGRGAALGYAAGIGPIGAVLGSFGPWGVAAAAGIGLVTNALSYMQEQAEKVGDQSSSLRQFADGAGLTITQVRGLNDAGGSLGVSSEQMSSAIQKFTLNLGEARKGGGDLYEQLRIIDKQLADDISTTRDGAEALDLLSRAYNSTADATTKAAIAKAAFGKGGGSVGPVLGVLGEEGGVNKYSEDVAKALGVTDEWTKKVAALRNENKSLAEDLKLIETSFYGQAMLERQNAALKTQIEIVKAFRDSADAIEAMNIEGQRQIAASAGVDYKAPTSSGRFPAGGDPVVDSGAVNAQEAAIKSATQAKIDNANATQKMASEAAKLISYLGAGATAAEKEEARVLALNAALAAGAISQENYNRAAAANPAVKAASEATQAIREQNEIQRAGYVSSYDGERKLSDLEQARAQESAVHSQQRIASEQAYDKVLKDTGDKKEAQNRSDEVGLSYQNQIAAAADRIKDAQHAAAASALEWQQNMLGVSAAAQSLAAAAQQVADAFNSAEQSAMAAATTFGGIGASFGGFDVPKGTQYTSSVPIGTTVANRGGGQGMVLSSAEVRTRTTSGVTSGSLADQYVSKGDYAGAIQAIERMTGGGLNRDGTYSPFDVNAQMSQVDTLTQLLNSQTSDKGKQVSNLQSELAWLNTLPETIARDQRIVSLTQSIDQLRNSTDGLNSTNQDLLSPYYTQDPRTSHIGFRSQGMAEGGFPVPGTPSANDNMLATFPVASGENILYVDPQFAKRGMKGGGGTTVNNSVSVNVTIAGNASKDEVGRTMYQVGQTLSRQLSASNQ